MEILKPLFRCFVTFWWCVCSSKCIHTNFSCVYWWRQSVASNWKFSDVALFKQMLKFQL